MSKKFSIITACHNNAQFLGKYFDSVCSQNYSNLEIIFVDDASTDDSLAIAQKIEDPRVKVISLTERAYCSSAYARALEACTGDICGVVDADDALGPMAVRKLAQKYVQHPHLGYIYTQHWWCDVNLKKKRKGVSSMPKRNWSFAQMASKGAHCFSHWRTFRTELRDKAKLFPEGLRMAVDKNLGFVLQSVAPGGYLDEPHYLYRYYKGNMSRVYPKEQKTTWKSLASEYVRRIAHPVVRI